MFNQLIQLRQSIYKGHMDRTMSDSFFVFDILKAIYDDNISEFEKLEVLVFLEEHASTIVEISSACDVLSSLLDIYNQSLHAERSSVTNQFLVATTTIVVLFDAQTSEQGSQLTSSLVDIICKTKERNSESLQLQALTCLRELELSKPGLLFNKLSLLHELTLSVKSFIYQEYASLFVLCLRNAVAILAQQSLSTELSTSALNDCLFYSTYSQQIAAFQDSPTLFEFKLHGHVLPPTVDSTKLAACVSSLVDHFHCLSSEGVLTILLHLCDLITLVPTLSPLVFKPVILQRLSNLSLVDSFILLFLWLKFGQELFTITDSDHMMKHFVNLTCDLMLPSTQRLIVVHWISCVIQSSKTNGHEKLFKTLYRNLLPTVFDGVDTQAAKISLLSICIPTDKENDLLDTVSILYSLVSYRHSHKAASALFKSLYHMYVHHSFQDKVKEMILRLALSVNHVVPFILNFLDKLAIISSVNCLDCHDILTSLQKQVTSSVLNNTDTISLRYILQVLHKTTLDPTMSPKTTLVCIEKLLHQSQELISGSWVDGNSIIAIINNIICVHDLKPIYTDVADLLFYMMQNYQNLDVADRVKFYYMLLIGASQEKIVGMLTKSTEKTELASIVGSTPTITNQKVVSCPDDKVLSFKQEKVCGSWAPELLTNPQLTEDDLRHDQHLSIYMSNLALHKLIFTVQCLLALPITSKYPSVYAITLQATASNSAVQQIDDIHVPVLHAGESVDVTFQVELKKPCPIKLHVYVLFCTKSQQTWREDLGYLTISFTDLFMQLPFELSGLRKHDFSEILLQNLITQSQNETDKTNNCIQSVCKLDTQLNTLYDTLQQYYPQLCYKIEENSTFAMDIFLPPQCHMFIRYTQQDEYVVMTTTMDTCSILSGLSTFIDNIKHLLSL